MNRIKVFFKWVLGQKNARKLGQLKPYIINLKSLIENTFIDGMLFYKHSMVFKKNNFNKIESEIILHYHGIEKGFLFSNFKYRFGEFRVKELVRLLKNEDVIENNKRSQIAAAYLSMCRYYEKHQKEGIDISDYYKIEDYITFKSLSTLNVEIIKNHTRESFFESRQLEFSIFSQSRMSTRSFTGEIIPFATINKVIEIAKTAPSVCNRQPTKVYYTENKTRIDRILDIQEGLKGYTKNINQLLILVTDRNFFYSIGERNQLYIDGGIFLMNLLYSLHYYGIGACPAHWGFNQKQDKQIQREINLSESEKVICLIPIGIPKDEFKTTLSLRRNNVEIIKIID